jgi:hypothetical protein
MSLLKVNILHIVLDLSTEMNGFTHKGRNEIKIISNGYISTCKFPGTNHLVVTTIMKVRLPMN